MGSIVDRMLRAAKRDVRLYEEVEHSPSLTGEAALVVVIVSIASGIGTLDRGLLGLLWGTVGALLGWAIWAWVVYFVGTRILPGRRTSADWGEIARGTGYAQSVGVLRIFAFIPVIGWLISVAASIWQLVCMVTAVREALDYDSTLRAVAVVIIGAIPFVILNFVLVGLLLGWNA